MAVYQEQVELARTNTCAECGGTLVVGWDKEQQTHIARCSKIATHKGYTRILSPPEAYDAGAPQLDAERLQVAAKRGQVPGHQTTGPTQVLVPRTLREDLQTGLALNRDAVAALIAYAQDYGLDPYRGHVCLMYGEPYITLDGYLYVANQSKWPYRLASHPLSAEEQRAYLVKEGEHAWLCELTLLDTGQLVTGLGIVTVEEMTEMSKKHPDQLRSPVVAVHPQIMAQKRAEWQALRRAFPLERKA